jgi:hypothetical protein
MPKRKRRKLSHSEPKTRKRRVPQAVRTAVIAGAIRGESQRETARRTGLSRNTVAKIYKEDELGEMLHQEELHIKSLVPKAVKVLEDSMEEGNKQVDKLSAAKDILYGTQMLKPKTEKKIEHKTVVDQELERRGLAGRSEEELEYWLKHGYFPEEEERYGGKPIGAFATGKHTRKDLE